MTAGGFGTYNSRPGEYSEWATAAVVDTGLVGNWWGDEGARPYYWGDYTGPAEANNPAYIPMVSSELGNEGCMFQHAGILTLGAVHTGENQSLNGRWTKFQANGVDVRSDAPGEVFAVAVSDKTSLLPTSINVSWQDHSSNDSGFTVQRYDVTNGVATLGQSWTVQGTFLNDDTIDWDTFSADSIYYRVGSKYSDNSDVTWALPTNNIVNPHQFRFSTYGSPYTVLTSANGAIFARSNNSVAWIPETSTRPIIIDADASTGVVVVDQYLASLSHPEMLRLESSDAMALAVWGGSMEVGTDIGASAAEFSVWATGGASVAVLDESVTDFLVGESSTMTLDGGNFEINSLAGIGRLEVPDTGTLTVVGSIAFGSLVNNGSVIIGGDDDIALSGEITGTGTVTKIGSGTLVVSGSSTNPFSISDGTISIASGTFGQLDGTGNLQIAGDVTMAGLNWNGSLAVDEGALLWLQGTLSGSVNLTNNGLLVIDNANDDLYLVGTLSGSGDTAINSFGQHSVYLNCYSDYTGSLVLVDTTVYLGGDSAISPDGTLEGHSANIDLQGYYPTTANLWLEGGSITDGGMLTAWQSYHFDGANIGTNIDIAGAEDVNPWWANGTTTIDTTSNDLVIFGDVGGDAAAWQMPAWDLRPWSIHGRFFYDFNINAYRASQVFVVGNVSLSGTMLSDCNGIGWYWVPHMLTFDGDSGQVFNPGNTFKFLTASSITGSLGDHYTWDNGLVNYAWGDNLSAEASAYLPTLDAGLHWAIYKQQNQDSSWSLVLKVQGTRQGGGEM